MQMSAEHSGIPLASRTVPVWSEYRFKSELSETLTIVVRARSQDGAKEELARIGLHPSFFDLLEQ